MTQQFSFEMRNILLPVRQVELVKQFFITKLHYREREDEVCFKKGWVALMAPSGIFTTILAENNSPGPPSRIIINTSDCLRDYYYLKQDSFRFLGEPQYFSFGLAVDFTDAAGNLFMLLEEREY
ncbi:MAG TPA: hypothetical protein VGD90_10385 [Sphingobacteriaceae bacterium]